MQLQPHEMYTIVRGIENHLDTETYYIRAVIRNARTGVTIDTINLDNSGDGHYFSKVWQVPADPSGQGFYISIVISVYTDSGYTTKSENYTDKYEEHLVAVRYIPQVSGAWSNFDYKKIQKIVQEELDSHKPQIKSEEPKEVKVPEIDIKPILNAILELNERLNKLSEEMSAQGGKIVELAQTKDNEFSAKLQNLLKNSSGNMNKSTAELIMVIKDLKDIYAKVISTREIRNQYDKEKVVENNSLGDYIPEYKKNKIPSYRIKIS